MEGKKYRTRVGQRSPGRPKRTEQGKMDTDALILHHAGKLFMKSGYAAVSISSITRVVGITKPTLYHYFPDKEHLYAAVLCDQLEQIMKESWKKIDSNQSLRSKLFDLAYGYFRSASFTLSTFIRDVEEHLNPSLRKRVYDAYERCILMPYVQMFQRAMEAGEIENQPERLILLAKIWLGMLDSLSVQFDFAKTNLESNLLEAVQTVVSLYLDGITMNRRTLS